MIGNILALREHLAGHGARLILGVIASAAAALLAALPWILLGEIVGLLADSPGGRASGQPFVLLAVIAAAVLARVLLAGLGSAFCHVAAYDILRDIRMAMTGRFLQVPLSRVEAQGRGALTKVVLQDVEQLELFLAHHLPDLVAALLVPLGLAAFLLFLHWPLGLAIVLPPLLSLLLLKATLGTEKNAGFAAEFGRAQEDLSARVSEFVSGLPVVRIFGGRGSARAYVAESIDKTHELEVSWVSGSLLPFSLHQAIIASTVFIVVGFGGWLFAEGALSLADWVLFLCLGPAVTGPLDKAMRILVSLMEVNAGAGRIRGLLAWEPLAPSGDVAESIAGGGFEVSGVGLELDGRPVLRDLSLSIPETGLTAIVGKTGSGKSSLLKLLGQFEAPTAGRILFAGRPLGEIPAERWLRHVGFAFQETFLKRASVRDNLRLARPEADDAALDEACRTAGCTAFLAALPQGLDTIVGEGGWPLSGGQQQRLALARVLLRNPSVLFLDEALAHVDLRLEDRIVDRIRAQRSDRATVMVSHRLGSAAKADHVVVMAQGRVVAEGPHADLLRSCDDYRRLWSEPQAVRAAPQSRSVPA